MFLGLGHSLVMFLSSSVPHLSFNGVATFRGSPLASMLPTSLPSPDWMSYFPRGNLSLSLKMKFSETTAYRIKAFLGQMGWQWLDIMSFVGQISSGTNGCPVNDF